jgi:hypothetical protein
MEIFGDQRAAEPDNFGYQNIQIIPDRLIDLLND